MVKKKISMLLAAVLVASGVAVAAPAKAETKVAVTYAAPARTMIEVDNKMEFTLQANTAEAVEYRVWAQNVETGKWVELTDGYELSEVGTNPFIPATVKNLEKGAYKASIWVRKAGSEAKYDSYVVRSFKIQEDGYFAERANMDDLGLKDTYKVGQSVALTGADEYKLHIFDPSVPVRADGWMIDDTYEGAEATSYTFTKAGTYLVDVWGKKADSTNKYDGWVLKVVTVTEGEAVGTPEFEVVDADTTKLPMQTLVQIKLTTETPEDYKVFVGAKELELKTNAAGEEVFIGVVDGTLTADQVKAAVEVKSIVKEEAPVFTVVDADTTKLPMQTLVQIKLETETPENWTVKVGEKELELKTNAAGEEVFIGVVDGSLTADQVTAAVTVE